MKQDIRIAFTYSKKQRPIDEIIDDGNSSAAAILNSPSSLIGNSIQHKFTIESLEEKWYNGVIIDYNFENKTFDLVYEDDDEH